MKQTFEKAMSELEEISKKLSADTISLDEGIKLYTQGVKLLKFCNDKLNEADLIISEVDIEGLDKDE